MIRMSVKGLIRYMEGDEVAKRRVLTEFKFPDEGKAASSYYREATPAICQCVTGKISSMQMLARAEILVREAESAPPTRRARLRHNARAIVDFHEHFGDMSLQGGQSQRLSYVQGGVRVAVHPELWFVQRGEQHLLKLELGTESLSTDALQTLAQLLYHAASQAGLALAPRQVGVLEVATGKIHRGKRVGPRLERRLAAALENIEAIWPSIKKPTRVARRRPSAASPII